MHTNIATAVVKEITTRGLDKLFEAEDNFEGIGSLHSTLQTLEKLLSTTEKGRTINVSIYKTYLQGIYTISMNYIYTT